MAKTNARWIYVLVDDQGDDEVNISENVISVSNVGTVHDQQDVTGYSDGWHNITLGQPSAPITVSGPYSNAVDSTMNHILVDPTDGILGDQSRTYTLTVQIGQKAAPGGGEPEFSGEYYAASYVINGADMTYTAEFVPAGATSPAWSTV
jgi:hypothetical protein